MFKTYEKQFTFFQKLLDLIVIYLCYWLAYWIRFETFIPEAEQGLELYFLKFSFIALAINYYFLRREGLYTSQRLRPRWQEVLSIVRANSSAFVVLILVIYFFKERKISRIALTNFFVLGTFFLVSARLIVRNILRKLRMQGKNLRHVILFGDGEQIAGYLTIVKAHPELGLNIKGWYQSNGKASKAGITELEGDVSDILNKYKPDVVVLGHSSKQNHATEELMSEFNKTTTDVQLLPDWSYSFLGQELVDLAGVPVIMTNRPQMDPFDVVAKRIFDFVFSLLGLIVISPILIAISLLVKLSSRGPVLYGQKRMGLDGKEFTMWKFRSMKVNAEADSGAQWAIENDPRRTKLGTFLRSTSLDELPQLWNVLNGDMSLVGPRPERRVFVDQFKHQIPAYMLRHKMKAGITGWAQINGWRGDTCLKKRIECDIYYIKHWSLWLDIKILFLTLWKGFINKNAY